jgi:glycosyltransferase involved in cell wall biosynthesis
MGIHKRYKICLIPNLTGIGGMVSFQNKLGIGLKERGIELSYDLQDPSIRSILVIGGTRRILGLWRARNRGVRIIQRLDGMNWLHRVRFTGLRHYMRAEYGNLILRFIRSRLTHGIVYQSQFAHKWWEKKYGPVEVAHSVIYNGVDLQVFTSNDLSTLPADRIRVLVVEGRLEGGYESGLENALKLVREIKSRLNSLESTTTSKIVELTIVGRVQPQMKSIWKSGDGLMINWLEQISHDQIPEVDRSAHLLFSADLNPACPNAVIEALACGTPVVAFDTGALPELVSDQAGIIVPYGGNPWLLEPPDIPSLAEAAIAVYHNQTNYRNGARSHAERSFSLDTMVDGYLRVLMD